MGAASNEPDFGAMLRNRWARLESRPTLSNISALRDALEDQRCRDSSYPGPGDAALPPTKSPVDLERRQHMKKVLFFLLGLALLLAFALPTQPLPGFEGEDVIPGSYDHKKRDHLPAQRCLGLLLLVSLYWATEPISPHITAWPWAML